MAVKAKRPCAKIGCRNLTLNGKYCKEHNNLSKVEKAIRNNFYDNNVRNKKIKEFYQSREWKKTRDYILKQYNGLDLFAYYIENKIIYANTAHHIVEVKDDWSLRLNADNLFPITEGNHNKIHAMYAKDKEGTQELLGKIIKKFKNEFKKQTSNG